MSRVVPLVGSQPGQYLAAVCPLLAAVLSSLRAQLRAASLHHFSPHGQHLAAPLFCIYTEPTKTELQQGCGFHGALEVGEQVIDAASSASAWTVSSPG